MSANLRETLIGIAKVAQTDIATANVDADFLRFSKLNDAVADITPNVEDDAAEIGKGNEFPNNTFLVSWNGGAVTDKYASSEWLSILLAFGLGKSTVSQPDAGAFRHTAVPIDPSTDGIELPYLSYVEEVRPTGNVITDRMLVGNMLSAFTVSIGSGPGRANSKANGTLAWSGKLADPSGITLPGATVEHLLPSASLSMIINGDNYVSNRNIISLEWDWKNNPRLDDGYFPGSGFQTSGDPATGSIRGRIEVGDRANSFRFTVRKDATSTELAKLIAQTEGTAVFGVEGALIAGSTHHDLNVSFPRVRYDSVKEVSQRGLLGVEVRCTVLFDENDGLLTAYATNTIPLVGSET